MGHAERLAGEVGARPTDRREEVPLKADFFLVALPDGEVAAQAELFSDRKGIWVHTAGALPMNLFTPFHKEYGVLYPLQTLTRERLISMQQVPLLVEGSSPAVTDDIKTLASSISEEVREVDSRTRLVIHLAAVFASNFSNHMAGIAEELLRKEGESYRLLLPLLHETIDKLEEMEPAMAQTGPAARGDEGTIAKHLELLREYPEWQKLYTFISRDIAKARKVNR
jgi:predicted short-subunit dehydrogenase-like oxidoreductase (DUF2520 family)